MEQHTQLIALLIIGAILLVIIGAFVLSPSFRKDVISSDGEASILGLFNVKGVLIVLLVAIFCGAFIYISRLETSETTQQNNVAKKASIEWIGMENVNKKIMIDSTMLCEINPLMGTSRIKKTTRLGEANEVSGIPGFHFKLDSIEYIFLKRPSYRFCVKFGEKNKQGDIIWQNSHKTFYKTSNGRLADDTEFVDVSDHQWKRHYKVMMTLGQPDSLLKYVNNMQLIVASSEVNIQK